MTGFVETIPEKHLTQNCQAVLTSPEGEVEVEPKTEPRVILMKWITRNNGREK